ncbi:GNAT family N-acetyltransferase [Agromyces sp. MMS24-K17]|uniref:GNAT family N-acetyltransferase n=1 Tax=Agromyces sp. MMS24-K17 TaxID=3372850 RepID=UPI003753EED4
MEPRTAQPFVRRADLAGPDAATVGELVAAYLEQTLLEESAHTGVPIADGGLPERYRGEVDDPARAYERATVLLGGLGETPLAMAVVWRAERYREIKRVWVDPLARGRRIGSALIRAALDGADAPTRLTVWDWREDAIRLYRRHGFVPMPSWESRPRLLCMEVDPAVPKTG